MSNHGSSDRHDVPRDQPHMSSPHHAARVCRQQIVGLIKMGACLGRCERFAKSRKSHRTPRSNENQRPNNVVVYQQYSKLNHEGTPTPDLVRAMPKAHKAAGYRIVLDKDPDAAVLSDADGSQDIENSKVQRSAAPKKTDSSSTATCCPVCCHEYSAKNVPKLLSCSHTICATCVTRTSKTTRKPGLMTDVKGTEGGLVTFCPFCRQATNLPEEGGADALESDDSIQLTKDQPETIMEEEHEEDEELSSALIDDQKNVDVDTEQSSDQSPTASNKTVSTTATASTTVDPEKIVAGHQPEVASSSTALVSKNKVFTVTSESCVGCRIMVADVQLDCKHFVCRLCAYTGLLRLYQQRHHQSTPIMNQLNDSFCPMCNDVKIIRFEFDVIPSNTQQHLISTNGMRMARNAIRECLNSSPVDERVQLIYPELSMNMFTTPPVLPQRMFNRRQPLQYPLTHRSFSCPVQTGRTLNDIPATEYTHSASYHQITEHLLADFRQTPPIPPRRRVYKTSTSSQSLSTQLVCIKRFGRYSRVKMQTGAFESPTKVAVSLEGHIAVVDQQQMVVQIFTSAADYLSMFKVMGVQAVCFLNCDKLACATHRGVYVYTTSGHKLQRLFACHGPVTCISACKFGFIASTLNSVAIFNSNQVEQKLIEHRTYFAKPLLKVFSRRKCAELSGIRDAAVNTAKDLVLLDNVAGVIYIIDENGNTKQVINPAQHVCGKLKNAQALAVDKSDNIIIADTGNQRLLQFNNNGVFTKCLLNVSSVQRPPRRQQSRCTQLYPHGVCVTQHGLLIVVLSGIEQAHVRIYQSIEMSS